MKAGVTLAINIFVKCIQRYYVGSHADILKICFKSLYQGIRNQQG